MDWWHRILRVLDHNRWVAAGVAVAVVWVVGAVGCQVTTEVDGMEMDERKLVVWAEGQVAQLKAQEAQLAAERERLGAAVEGAFEDLAEKQARRDAIFNSITGLVQAGVEGATPGIGSLLGSILSAGGIAMGVAGLGAVRDNRRKDAVIEKLKNGEAPL